MKKEVSSLKKRIRELEGMLKKYEPGEKTGGASSSGDTALARSEEDMAAGEKRYRRLVENMNEVIYETDMTGKIVYLTSNIEKILGYTPQDMLDRQFMDFLYPADVDIAKKLFEKGFPESYEADDYRVYHKNGELRWVRASRSPIYENGSIIGIQGIIVDVTERKKTEELLLESEERYRNLVELSPDGIILHKKGIIQYANQAIVDLIGTNSATELIGKPVIQFVHPDYRAEAANRIKAIIGGEKLAPWMAERFILPDGREFDVEVAAIPLRMNDELYIQTIIRDISERKRGELTIRDSEERFRAIFDNSLDGILLANIETMKFYSGNRAICSMLGYEPDEIPSLGVKDIHPEWGLPLVIDHFKRQGEEGGYIARALPVKRKDGSVFYADVNASIVTISGKKYQLGMFHDVTELKRTTDDLMESEERFRMLTETAPIGIFLTGASGGIVYANPHLLRLTGVSLDEIARNGWAGIVHQDDLAPVLESWADAVQRGTRWMKEHRMLSERGEVVWARSMGTPVLSDDGAVLGYVGVVEDITEQKKLESEQIKSQKLESMGVLAGGIAHDFNNILTSILGNISLSKMMGSKEPEIIEHLGLAEKAALRAKDLTQQLLTFARGGAPVKKTITLPGVIRDSAEFVCHGTRVNCSFELPDNLLMVEADEGQLSQVIQNLAINAIQAMPEGGTISIKARNVSVSQGKFVKLTVSDTGTGISPENLNRIFDPYFTTKQNGSGLGLATAYSIIKHHGGSISVESKPGRGTTFQIFMPASERPYGVDREERITPGAGAGKILVMDDEQSIRDTACAILKTLGYEAESAGDGTAAVDRYRTAASQGRPFDAVIIDLTVVGGMGGEETIKALLGIDPRVRAIVSSGYSSDPVMSRFTEFGFCDVLAKPYRIEDVAAVLHRVLKG
ncbi:MAG TPA: PAS domain S-box protein [Spirochaetota bacterium]|nr:PAS domain S-box protein [Spirochaetota bacterium]